MLVQEDLAVFHAQVAVEFAVVHVLRVLAQAMYRGKAVIARGTHDIEQVLHVLGEVVGIEEVHGAVGAAAVEMTLLQFRAVIHALFQYVIP